MDTNLSIHSVLREYDLSKYRNNGCYLGSILLINKDIPLFEEEYGNHEYDWLLRVTENRKCKQVKPVVIRYLTGKNLSMDYAYRKENLKVLVDILIEYDNLPGVSRACGSFARFLYKIEKYEEARHYFDVAGLYGSFTVKNILYYYTSFIPCLARWIVKKFNVFG